MFCLVRLEDPRRRHLQMGVLVETETRGGEWWSSKKLDTSLTVCCPVCKSNTLSLKKPHGLAVHAQVYCSSCEQVVSERYLASKRDLKSKIFDINTQAVYSSLACGLGSSTFNNFCESMDLPGLHHKTFHSHAKAMYSKLEMLEDCLWSDRGLRARSSRHVLWYNAGRG